MQIRSTNRLVVEKTIDCLLVAGAEAALEQCEGRIQKGDEEESVEGDETEAIAGLGGVFGGMEEEQESCVEDGAGEDQK